MSNPRSVKADLLFDSKAILGEGPVWDHRKQQLFWVDIEGCKLHSHHPATNTNLQWDFEEMPGVAVPAASGKLLLGLESGLASFDLQNKTLTPLKVLENSDPVLRYNDGKCDPLGNFWIGSMHKEFLPGTGNLYRIDHNLNSSIQIPKTTISNGMAWSPDHSQFYYIDSPSFEVVAFDFDPISCELANKRSLFKIPESFGSPDGMTIDREGMLWIAHWGGGCVRQWNPMNGEVINTITVDAPQVTSCCFGGEDLNMLYITTARSGLDEQSLENAPLSGGLFCIETKVRGFPVTYFKGKI